MSTSIRTVLGVTVAPGLKVSASGSISNGDKVVMNANGTVSAVSETATNFSDENTVSASNISVIDCTYDSTNNKIVVVYRDPNNSNYGTAVVGTISGTSITFGTPVVFVSSTLGNVSCCYDTTNQKVIIAYYTEYVAPGGSNLRAIVGTVSGTTISFGTPSSAFAECYWDLSITYDPNEDAVLVAYTDDLGTGQDKGYGIVGNVSGTNITFGTKVKIEDPSVFTYDISSCFDSVNNKVIVTYSDTENGPGKAVVATISGTSVSFGTPGIFRAAEVSNFSVYSTSVDFDTTAQKVVVFYGDQLTASSYNSVGIVGTVSGTGISFGDPVVFSTSEFSAHHLSSTYHPADDKTIVVYSIGDVSNLAISVKLKEATVSNTSISFGSEVSVLNSNPNGIVTSVYASTGEYAFITYGRRNVAYYPTSILRTNLTDSNYIGISSGSYTNGQTAIVQTAGLTDDAQASLTPGESYYVQTDGTLSTTPDNPSVFAGTAISATKIIVKG